jgi:hypothetical protein
MKKNQYGFSTIEGLIILLVAVVIGATGWLVFQRQHKSAETQPVTTKTSTQSGPASHEQVKTTADDYLISQVGKDRFEKYYSFDQNRTSYASPKDSKYDFIAYHFSPWKAVTHYDDVIMVQVNRDNVNEVLADSVPNCVKDDSLCNFKVDNDKATSIAKDKGLSTSDLALRWSTKHNQYAQKNGLPFVIVASSCSSNKSIFVDYRNGKVLGTENNCGALD